MTGVTGHKWIHFWYLNFKFVVGFEQKKSLTFWSPRCFTISFSQYGLRITLLTRVTMWSLWGWSGSPAYFSCSCDLSAKSCEDEHKSSWTLTAEWMSWSYTLTMYQCILIIMARLTTCGHIMSLFPPSSQPVQSTQWASCCFNTHSEIKQTVIQCWNQFASIQIEEMWLILTQGQQIS